MKHALEKAVIWVAASFAAFAVLSSVARLADADRAAIALAKQSKAALVASHTQQTVAR